MCNVIDLAELHRAYSTLSSLHRAQLLMTAQLNVEHLHLTVTTGDRSHATAWSMASAWWDSALIVAILQRWMVNLYDSIYVLCEIRCFCYQLTHHTPGIFVDFGGSSSRVWRYCLQWRASGNSDMLYQLVPYCQLINLFSAVLILINETVDWIGISHTEVLCDSMNFSSGLDSISEFGCNSFSDLLEFWAGDGCLSRKIECLRFSSYSLKDDVSKR
jgi:hypothetical protein